MSKPSWYTLHDYRFLVRETDAKYLSAQQRKKLLRDECKWSNNSITKIFIDKINNIIEEKEIFDFIREKNIQYGNFMLISRFCHHYSDLEELCKNWGIYYILRYSRPENLEILFRKYHIKTRNDFTDLLSLPYFEHLKKILKNSSVSSFSKDLDWLIESENFITVPTWRIAFDPNLLVDTCSEADDIHQGILEYFFKDSIIFMYRKTIIWYQKISGEPSFLAIHDVHWDDGTLLLKKWFIYAIDFSIYSPFSTIEIENRPIRINPVRMARIKKLTQLIDIFISKVNGQA